MADHMVDHNDGLHRDMNFFRLVHDWELDSITLLFNTLYSVRMGRGVEDKFSWNLLRSKLFTKSSPTSTPLSLGRAYGGSRLL